MLKSFVVIDDDDDGIDVLCEAIKYSRPLVHCMSFKDGKEAIDCLTADSLRVIPDFIFVDYNMPLMNGMECTKKLRQDTRFDESVIIIFSTGMNPDDSKEFYRLGADFVYAKPHTVHSYVQLLAAVLHGPAAKR